MKKTGIAANGIAALFASLLLLTPPSATAEETATAELISIDILEASRYTHRVSVRLDSRVEHLLLNSHAALNQLNIFDSNGISLPQSGVAYRGIIEGLPQSRAELVIDDDFISGTLRSNGEIMQISSGDGIPNYSFGTTDKSIFPPANTNRRRTTAQIVEVPIAQTFGDSSGNVTRVAKVGIVVDALYNEAIAGRGVSKAIATINSVDALYREKFGLALKVDSILLATDETTLPLSGDTLEENLGQFRDHRINSELLPSDLALVHLFTGIDSHNNSIGLAYSDAACREDGYDVSMSRPFLFPTLLTAHEIGHNLGAIHDDETIDCRSINDQLMFSEINPSTNREFSSCSVDDIRAHLQVSGCYSAAINISLDVEQLESNQILATVTNLDETRAIPGAVLSMQLENVTVAEAPAPCTLDTPSVLTCDIYAMFAGDSVELAVKLRLDPDPDENRMVTASLTPTGFYDLNDENNYVEVVLPGEAQQPLNVTDAVITTQGASADSGGNGGGGSLGLLLLGLLAGVLRYRKSLRATRH